MPEFGPNGEVTLSTREASNVLVNMGYTEAHLQKLVKKGALRPIKDQNNLSHWTPEDIFRAFLFMKQKRKFIEKYGNKAGYDLSVTGDVTRIMGKREFGEYLLDPEWKDVVEKATTYGVDFTNTPFKSELV